MKLNYERLKKACLFRGYTVNEVLKELSYPKKLFSDYVAYGTNVEIKYIFGIASFLDMPIKHFYQELDSSIKIETFASYF